MSILLERIFWVKDSLISIMKKHQEKALELFHPADTIPFRQIWAVFIVCNLSINPSSVLKPFILLRRSIGWYFRNDVFNCRS